MEEYFLNVKTGDSEVSQKLKLIDELFDEVYFLTPQTLKDFLQMVLKKHKICLDEEIKVDIATQTDDEMVTNDWNTENIANDVALVAKKNLEDNGFVYDHSSGLYYDHKLQCYYNPEYKLYYYHQTGAYYYYDEESKSLKYYCTASSEVKNNKSNDEEKLNKVTKESNDLHLLQKDVAGNLGDSSWKIKNYNESSYCFEHNFEAKDTEKEEGECSDSDDDLPTAPAVIEAGPKSFEPDHSKHLAPCIRVLVTSSTLSNLVAGTLFIVTCTGGTLGREGNHDILIPDIQVSKLHSSFRYVYRDGCYLYEIIDMGSKNGTFLNGKRLSETLVRSDPYEVTHGSTLTVGCTNLLCHIHPKDETCQECEPFTQERKLYVVNELTLREKHSQEALAIRKKFGIAYSPIIKYPHGYEDRAEMRRKTKGSFHHSEKTQSTSTDVPIEQNNKGFALMTKMGWVQGTALGKNENGLLEPLEIEGNEDKHGFGCESTYFSSNSTSKESKRMAIAKKTEERFQQIQ